MGNGPGRPVMLCYRNRVHASSRTAAGGWRRWSAAAGIALAATTFACACLAQVALTPVSRFYNLRTGTHFYTASSIERDHVILTYPQFLYEGVAYYVYGAPVPPPGNPGNIAPKVSLAASAATIPGPGQVTLAATASDDDGQVAKVMFYQGSIKLTEMTTAPYSYTLNVTVAGDYAYSAVAVGHLGASTTSAGGAATPATSGT